LFPGLIVVSIIKKSFARSSGGNAGNAVAVAGKKLNIPVDVFVPRTTLPLMIDKMKRSNANVMIAGNNWNEADAQARLALASTTDAQYIPPFDDPLIWEGHSSIVDELSTQLPSTIIPDAIVVAVGGGGLLRGIQLGIHNHQWKENTRIFAAETEGAASFAASKLAGKLAKLDEIDTIATTLGALQVTPAVLIDMNMTESIVVSDKQAVHACLQYANENQQLVEPSCGASLAILYDQKLREKYLETMPTNNNNKMKHVVFIICGGSAVNLELLSTWKQRFGL
jgi:L-serine/L-threonine ammonia-lyase